LSERVILAGKPTMKGHLVVMDCDNKGLWLKPRDCDWKGDKSRYLGEHSQ
jgi:hypothetical protein